ncbi:MAG: hypothetical protein AVDCRST_MAG62-1406, partial [uncultured Sphingomonas sp.]
EGGGSDWGGGLVAGHPNRRTGAAHSLDAGSGGWASGRAVRRLPRLCLARGRDRWPGADADGGGEHPSTCALHRLGGAAAGQPVGGRHHRGLHAAGPGSCGRGLSAVRRRMAAARRRPGRSSAGLLPRRL